MFINRVGSSDAPLQQPINHHLRKRKAEVTSSPPSKRSKNESDFQNILPPFFHLTNPLEFAHFEAQLNLIQDQLKLRRASASERQQIRWTLGILLQAQAGRERELAELAALSALLDRNGISLSQLALAPSFLNSLKNELFLEINQLKTNELSMKCSELDKNLPSYYEYRLVQLFAQMTYLTSHRVNPGIGALTSYLLKQTDYRLFVFEDHLNQLCEITAAVSRDARFIQSCQEAILVAPSMTRYLNAILLKGEHAKFNHYDVVQAFMMMLLSRHRQENEPHCYAIASLNRDKQNSPLEVFNSLKMVFKTGYFAIQGIPIPAAPLFELFIREKGLASLEHQLTANHNKHPLLAAVVFSITGHSIVDKRDLLNPEVRRVFFSYFSQLVHLPLLIPAILRGLNFDQLNSKKRILIDRLYQNLCSFKIPRFEKRPFQKACQKQFWFIELVGHPMAIRDDNTLEVLSGPLEGLYPLPSNQKDQSAVKNHLSYPKILISNEGHTIQLCLYVREFIAVLSKIIRSLPCVDLLKEQMVQLIQSNPEVIMTGVLEEVGMLDPAVIKVLNPSNRMSFQTVGGYSIQGIESAHNVRKVLSRGCPTGMIQAWFRLIQSSSLPLVEVGVKGHIFTTRRDWCVGNIGEIKERSETVASVYLDRMIADQEVRWFFNAVNPDKRETWCDKMKQLSALPNYRNAIFVIRSTLPRDKRDMDRASEVLDSKLLKVDPTTLRVRSVVEQLPFFHPSLKTKIIRLVRSQLHHQPAHPYQWANVIYQISATLGCPYVQTIQIEMIVARVFGLPESIYVGDTNWKDEGPIYRRLEYRAARGNWELTDRFQSKNHPCPSDYIVAYL